MGEVTEERLKKLRHADKIAIDTIVKHGLYDKIWQAFTVLIPVKTVGVMGDARKEGEVIVLRAIDSTDGMTADVSPIPYPILSEISTRIVNEVEGICRVTYDITSKPPATIEWE